MNPGISNFEIVYISYDEPSKEENFSHLRGIAPWAKRVDGIYGFDAAHRRAGELSETDHLFIVDGDNRVIEPFVHLELSSLNPDYIYSWSSKNTVNGLTYGNGGIKLWPRRYLLNLDCHDSGKNTDWCFQLPYFQMNDYYSYSCINTSPFHAFRAGFREGIKLCLDGQGKRRAIDTISPENLRRLLVWVSVGADVEWGTYAIFGARMGMIKLWKNTDFNYHLISNYHWIKEYWDREIAPMREKENWFMDQYHHMAQELSLLTKLPICNLDAMGVSLCQKIIC